MMDGLATVVTIGGCDYRCGTAEWEKERGKKKLGLETRMN